METNELIKLCKEALMNASGAYDSLRIVGADKCLPGLKMCEDKKDEALKAIDEYQKKMAEKI